MWKKIVFSNGPAPKCTFMDNGDTLEVIKQQFFHVLALLILQSQETVMYRSVKGYVWYNKTNLVIWCIFWSLVGFIWLSCSTSLIIIVVWNLWLRNIEVIEHVHLRFLKHS